MQHGCCISSAARNNGPRGQPYLLVEGRHFMTLTELAQHLSRDELTAFGIWPGPAAEGDDKASFDGSEKTSEWEALND